MEPRRAETQSANSLQQWGPWDRAQDNADSRWEAVTRKGKASGLDPSPREADSANAWAGPAPLGSAAQGRPCQKEANLRRTLCGKRAS